MSREDVEIGFKIELETRKLAQRMVAFDKSVQKTSRDVEKLGHIGKAMGKDYTKELTTAQKSISKFHTTVEKSHQQILKSREALASATTDVERKEIEGRIKLYESEKVRAIAAARMVAKESKKALEGKIGSVKLGDLAQQLTESVNDGMSKANFSEFAKNLSGEAKDALEDGFNSVKSKDLGGLIKAMGKTGSTFLKGVGGYGGAAAIKGGANLQAKGSEMGGAQGAALKMVGGVMSKMGPMLGSLAKMAPLISGVAGAFASIVKLMIDAESQAKEINKELLQGNALADTFAKYGSNANATYRGLSDTLETIRDQAQDPAMNISMGTTAKDHYAVISAIKKEGSSLENLSDSLMVNKTIADQASASNQKNLASLSQSLTKYTGLTSMAIGYSREFGVSIDEIASLQGELMSEMRMNAVDMTLEFSRMTDAAVESGIGVTKFFNIIRGVSQDLSLYGMRLKDVTKTLGLMGKTMSPRTAQKFMQFLNQGFKGKSMVDRVKSALLGGSKVTDAASKDVAEKMNDLIAGVMKSTGKSKADATAALENGDIQGPEREAYLRLQRRQKSMKAGGVLGTAAAMEDMGPAGTYEAVKAAMLRFGGGKDLKSMTNLGMLATEQGAGYSTEEQTQAMLFEQALEDQKRTLKNLFEKQAKGETLSDKDAKTLAKAQEAGISNSGLVEKADTFALYKTMDAAEEDQAKKAAEQLKAAYDSGKLSQTMVDKLEIIYDALINWIYKIMTSVFEVLEDIWDTLPGGDKEAKALAKMQVEAAKSNSRDLANTIMGASSSADAKDRIYKTKGYQDQTGVLMGAHDDNYNKAIRGIDDAIGGGAGKGNNDARGKKLLEAARAAGIDRDKYSSAATNMFDNDMSYERAMSSAGLSAEDQGKIFAKLREQMDPTELVKNQLAFSAGKPAAAAGTAPATPATQTAAAQKAAAPGTAGAGAAATPSPSTAATTPPTKGEAETIQQVSEAGIANVNSIKDLYDAMRDRGINLQKKTTDIVEKGALESIRKGLFEYAMYSSPDANKLVSRMQAFGGDVGAMAGRFKDNADNTAFLKANATGGLVTNVGGGLASISAAPGEGLASIGPGERILPANASRGGGGTNIQINVNGIGGNDLGNFLKARVGDLIYEYKRREKFT